MNGNFEPNLDFEFFTSDNYKRVELTSFPYGRFGTLWKRLGTVCGWCRCFGETRRGKNGQYYWRLCSMNQMGLVVVTGGWSVVPSNSHIEDLFESFVGQMFISGYSHNVCTRSWDMVQFFLDYDRLSYLKSDSFSELDLKLTMRAV